jgi:hypothetical protein
MIKKGITNTVHKLEIKEKLLALICQNLRQSAVNIYVFEYKKIKSTAADFTDKL